MKTYRTYFMLLALVVMGCSKSDDGRNDSGNQQSVDADYSVLLTHNDTLTSVLLNANLETINLNPGTSPLESIGAPQLAYREDEITGFYRIQPDCSGEITKHNFKNGSTHKIPAFKDMPNCQMVMKAMAFSGDTFFIAYKVPGSGAKGTHSYVRSIDASGTESTFTDIELDHEPLQITFSNDRLFILSIDANDSEKNTLVVLDTNTLQLIHEINLGSNVQKITRNMDGNVLVSYESQHLEVNSSTMAIVDTVRYDEGKEPKFGDSEFNYFDEIGNLYYKRPSGENSIYPTIPAVYDFTSNTAYLYIYELFLSQEQHQFEYKIGDTSMVSYDGKNNLLLVGYKKSDNSNKGGLLRIMLSSQPKFLDNIDLNGVPYDIFVD